MIRAHRPTRFPARFLMLARETFEASVAIHYDAPWLRVATQPSHAASAHDTVSHAA